MISEKRSGVLYPLQGSGWGWLGYNKATGKLQIATTANQDPLVTQARLCHCLSTCQRLLFLLLQESAGRPQMAQLCSVLHSDWRCPSMRLKLLSRLMPNLTW